VAVLLLLLVMMLLLLPPKLQNRFRVDDWEVPVGGSDGVSWLLDLSLPLTILFLLLLIMLPMLLQRRNLCNCLHLSKHMRKL
jgi:hypothetical protein